MEAKKNGWKLKEIILTAMICIVFGVAYLAAVYLASMIAAALTPAGLSPLGMSWYSACGLWPPL